MTTLPKIPQVVCDRCGKDVPPGMPFCSHCGSKVGVPPVPSSCPDCGAAYDAGIDVFCSRCGHRVGKRVSIELRAPSEPVVLKPLATGDGTAPRLSLLRETGEIAQTFTLDRGEAVIGRADADIQFASDHFMSPLHARIDLRRGTLYVRDLGSRNGTWVFIDQPQRLTDGDQMLVGSQVIRFRRLGYPGPHPPEADSTRRMGSVTPSVDIAVLQQLRSDGSVRDVFHLSPGRTVVLGRENGDWTFPYDQTMSGRHAEVRAEDNEFFVQDAGSRNGVATSVRGERALIAGNRILLGDQTFRVDSV